MAKPVPGKTYTVISGDTLSTIAAKAYGDPEQWPRIWNANQNQIKSDDQDIVSVGEVLFIPQDPVRENLKAALQENIAAGKDPNAFTLIVGGLEIPVISGRAICSMDTIADAWSATFAWEPGLDPLLDELTLPDKFTPMKLYLGSKLINTGAVYNVSTSTTTSGGTTKTLSGFSKAIDSVDSTIKPPYEQSNVTLKQRLETLYQNFGISIEYELENDSQFDRVTAGATEKIFDHAKKLVSQRGALFSSTYEGNVKVYKANVNGQTVGTLEEGKPGVEAWNGTWNSRGKFSTYKAIAQTPSFLGNNSAIAKDKTIPKSRFLTFSADDTIKGNLQDAADWKRSKQAADSMSQNLPATGWYAPNGKLWEKDTSVTVISKTLHIPNGFKYIIKSVEYIFGTKISAILTLVPPQVYTGKEIILAWA